MDRQGETVILKNRIAVFIWGFTIVWIAMLLAFTWLLVRDGSPDGYSPETMWAVVALFWLGGAGLIGYAVRKPCYIVSSSPGSVTFTWQYPLRRVRKTYAASELAKPLVVEEKDSDGDPYFLARLELPDGSVTDLAEGHDRKRCEDARDRFKEAITRA